jgi:hypothetical protein
VAFDSPPAYPGYDWYRDGRKVSAFELTTIAGPDHCGWQEATFLTIGWPIPRVTQTIADARQFVRDPRGVISVALRDRLSTAASVPADARATGYRHGPIEVYVSPTVDDAIFIVGPAGAERWPRNDPPIGCA